MRNTISKTHLIIACALALVCFLCAPAAAQSQDTGQQQQQQQQETPDFSDDRIQKTAEAYTEITKIREEYQDEFSQAEDSEQAQELQTRINEKITDAIEQNDMSVEDYNEVITAAQTDEDLRADLLDRIREMRE
ncbi:MAG: DUF4168 domain-containing protein [Desulfosalsimonas sp.]|uniref:DUF4168 domain-containing protein n=1 Tax=Desulfosalsimonas sp. TaxID=3073848 RepID=UPI0039706E12